MIELVIYNNSHLVSKNTKRGREESVGIYDSKKKKFIFKDMKDWSTPTQILNHKDLFKKIKEIETLNLENITPEEIYICEECGGLVILNPKENQEFKYICSNCNQKYYTTQVLKTTEYEEHKKGFDERTNERKVILFHLEFMEKLGMIRLESEERKSELMRFIEQNNEIDTFLKVLYQYYNVIQGTLKPSEKLIDGDFIINDGLYGFLDKFVNTVALTIDKDESTGIVTLSDEINQEVLFSVKPFNLIFNDGSDQECI